jgi:hypothetical protein
MTQLISPFTLDVSDEQLRDLRARVWRAVIPQGLPGAQSDYDPDPNFIRYLRDRLLHHCAQTNPLLLCRGHFL